MSRYAENTDVPAERSRMEIERVLTRYGADQFMYGTKSDMAVIAFRAKGRNVRFQLPFLSVTHERFTIRLKSGRSSIRGERGQTTRKPEHARAHWEQDVRQRWRALALAIKAKLEAVEAGITQFEEEFYAHIVLPTGKTIYEETHDKVALAYQSGRLPLLLPKLD